VIGALRRAWRADRWLVIAFGVLAAATVLPIWIGRYLPLLDLPNHLSAIAVWHYLDDPRFDFFKYYYLNLKPLPYWAHYYSVHLLAYAFGVEIANKLFLTVYAIALPSGAAAFARRFGRSPWLALFVFPLVWNFNLAEGFVAYVAGMAALVLALVVVARYAARPSLRGAIALVAIGSSIYFFHLLAYMMFLVCAGLLVFTEDEAFNWRRVLARGAPVLGCALIGVWAYLNNRKMGFASLAGPSEFNWDPLGDSMARVPPRLLNFLSAQRDEWVVIVLVLAWLAIAVTAARANRERPPTRLRELGPEVCFAAAALAALMLPRSMQRPFNWYMLNGRYVPLVALFGALLIRGPVAGWRRWLFVPVVAAGLFYAGDLSRMVVGFNRRVAGFDAIVAEIPPHKNTLTLVLPPLGDPDVNVNCFNQWPSYTQLRRGGYNFYNFNYGFPLKYRSYLPSPSWNHTELFAWNLHSRGWDYFLTHNEGAPAPFEIFPKLEKEGKVRLVDARGTWKLWQKIVDDPPPELPPPALPPPAGPAKK
jgi:hypothetical protein